VVFVRAVLPRFGGGAGFEEPDNSVRSDAATSDTARTRIRTDTV